MAALDDRLSVATAALAAAQALHRRDSDQLAELQEDLKARLEDLAAERDATKQQVWALFASFARLLPRLSGALEYCACLVDLVPSSSFSNELV